jgi:hypothetical protein
MSKQQEPKDTVIVVHRHETGPIYVKSVSSDRSDSVCSVTPDVAKARRFTEDGAAQKMAAMCGLAPWMRLTAERAPSEVQDRSIKHFCPVAEDDMSILTVVHQEGTPFGCVYSDEDARLISAAPELLAALQGVIDALGGEGFDWCPARAAIAKATGEPA